MWITAGPEILLVSRKCSRTKADDLRRFGRRE